MSHNDEWNLPEVPTSSPSGTDYNNGIGTMIGVPDTGGEFPFDNPPPPMDDFTVPEMDGIANLAQLPSSNSNNSISKDEWGEGILSTPEDDEFLQQQQEENQIAQQGENANQAAPSNKSGGNKGILVAMGLVGLLSLGGMGYLGMSLLGGSGNDKPVAERSLDTQAASEEMEAIADNQDGIEPPQLDNDGKLAAAPLQDNDIPQHPTASDIFADTGNGEVEKAPVVQSTSDVASAPALNFASSPALDVQPVKTQESKPSVAAASQVADKSEKTKTNATSPNNEKPKETVEMASSVQKVQDGVSKDENPPPSVSEQDPKDMQIRQLEAKIAELEMQKECVAPKHAHKDAKKPVKRDKKTVVRKEKADKKPAVKVETVQKAFPFKVSAISYGQIWLYRNANQTVPYTVGDILPSGEKVIEINYNNYTVRTTKNTYKVTLSS